MVHVDVPTLAMAVEGLRLTGPTFGGQFGARTLLVFLRHFGCIFCREMVKDLRSASTSIQNFPPVMFVYQGSVEQGQTFFEKHWPGVRAIADLPKRLYAAFGIRRATVIQGFGPMVWTCMVRAGVKGNGVSVGKPIGDPWLLPGMFLVEPGGAVVWEHPFKHVADHPDPKTIPRGESVAVIRRSVPVL